MPRLHLEKMEIGVTYWDTAVFRAGEKESWAFSHSDFIGRTAVYRETGDRRYTNLPSPTAHWPIDETLFITNIHAQSLSLFDGVVELMIGDRPYEPIPLDVASHCHHFARPLVVPIRQHWAVKVGLFDIPHDVKLCRVTICGFTRRDV